MKWVLLEEFSGHVKEKVVISNSQQGLTRSKPCLTDLISCHAEMSTFVDERGTVGVIYLDFNKAFVTVLYHVLVDKMRS